MDQTDPKSSTNAHSWPKHNEYDLNGHGMVSNKSSLDHSSERNLGPTNDKMPSIVSGADDDPRSEPVGKMQSDWDRTLQSAGKRKASCFSII